MPSMAGATLRTMLSIVPGSRGVGSLTFTVTEGNCPFKRPDTASASSRRFSIDRSSRRSFNVGRCILLYRRNPAPPIATTPTTMAAIRP